MKSQPDHYKPRSVKQQAELLTFLFEAWPDVKKKQVRIWLKHKAVMVNGRAISQFDHALQPGDVVAIRADRFAPPETTLPSGMKIHFEDADILVIDKPADLLTIASEAEQEKTAYFLITAYLRARDSRSKDRIWIVHRLDRETSGLMVFAKTADAKRILQGNWETFEKRYLAVVEGNLPAPEGVFRSHLDEANPFKVFIVPPSDEARHAVTHYHVMKRGKGRNLVELTLETGRRHQIRVQLSDAGCPIAGDKKYGAKTDPARRLALHACMLRFQHPATQKELQFESSLPRELAVLV